MITKNEKTTTHDGQRSAASACSLFDPWTLRKGDQCVLRYQHGSELMTVIGPRVVTAKNGFKMRLIDMRALDPAVDDGYARAVSETHWQHLSLPRKSEENDQA